MELLKLIGMWGGTFLILGYYIAVLMVMLITVVYAVGYLYDCLLGNIPYNLGVRIAKKNPKMRKIIIFVKIKRLIEPRKQFVRYETPLCAFCFSFTALALISVVLDSFGVEYSWVIAFFTYILFYFIGMYRRYRGKEEYDFVLENNLEFLRLSFVPLTFLITIIGFAFTIAGFNLQQIDWTYFNPIIASVRENGLVSGIANELWLVVKCSFVLLVLMYVASIPMQLVSYFFIHLIKYFRKYGNGYKKILNYFIKKWMSVLNI